MIYLQLLLIILYFLEIKEKTKRISLVVTKNRFLLAKIKVSISIALNFLELVKYLFML